MYTPYEKIELSGGTELAKVIEPYFNRTAEHFCSHQHAPSSGISHNSGITMGKDGIYIAWQIFTDYAEKGELIAKNVVCYALDLLLENEKSLETNLGSVGVATLMQQKEHNRTVAHLLYAAPVKRGKDIEIIEDIYPVSGVALKVKLPHEVERVYLAPQNKELEFETKDGYTCVNDITVDCHQMVVFEG